MLSRSVAEITGPPGRPDPLHWRQRHAHIGAGHRPRACTRGLRNPGRLRYFRAVRLSHAGGPRLAARLARLFSAWAVLACHAASHCCLRL